MKKLWPVLFFTVMIAAGLIMFPLLAESPAVFSSAYSDAQATMKKYENSWDDTEIISLAHEKNEYDEGKIAGYITIPAMALYELPVYYGENEINNNWQITTAGYLGNWGMLEDREATLVGAHNYQLFKTIRNLKVGDKFIIENKIDIYVYEVVGMTIYNAEIDDWKYVAVDASGDYSVTLVTCYPLDAVDTDNRYIVYSKLLSGTIYE